MYNIFFIVCVLIAAIAQIFLKKSADRNHEGISNLINLYTVAGYTLMLISAFGVAVSYRYISLITGVILDTTGYVFILLISYFIFKEKISKRKIIALILICGGIILSL